MLAFVCSTRRRTWPDALWPVGESVPRFPVPETLTLMVLPAVLGLEPLQMLLSIHGLHPVMFVMFKPQ